MNKHLLALGLLAFTSSGCATIVQSGPDRFMVDSNPKGGTVYIDEQPVGQTPVLASCSRSSECRVRIEKEGYAPFFFDKDKVLAGWFIGNLILGGPIGIAVDLIAHNQGKYTEDPIYVNMAPNSTPAEKHAESLPPVEAANRTTSSVH